MALDYKTRQATATNEQQHADDYCPECGRPWHDLLAGRARPAASVSWRAALLIVVGLALAISIGSRALAAYQTRVATDRDLAVLTLCDLMMSDPSCPSIQDAEDWRAVDVGNQATARRQLDRALVATAVEVLVFGAGLGSLARQRCRTVARHWGWSVVAAAWQISETLLVLIGLLVLALYLDLVAIQLSLKAPITRELLERAADDALGMISLIPGA
jgi:hypothetical protein